MTRFSKADRKQFQTFLQSPIFNRRDKVTILYEFILKQMDKNPEQDLDEEAAFKKVYPGEKFVVNKIRKIKAALLELLLEYLSFKDWKEKDNQGIHLLRALNEMGEETFFTSYFQKGIKETNKGQASLQSVEDTFALEFERTISEYRQSGRGEKSHFPEMIKSLERAELTRILKFTYMSLMREKIIGEVSCPDIFRKLINLIEYETLDHSLPRMYYLLLITLAPDSEWQDLAELKTLLKEHGEEVDSQEIRDIYLGAINNFLAHKGRPQDEMRMELWQLNCDMYELLVLERGLPLSPGQYKNMVMLGCRLDKLDWVEEFLTEAKRHLEVGREVAEEIQGFNRGVFYFYRKNYEEAERAFNRSFKRIPDIFYELDARAYLLMIFYEMGNSIGMESLTHSFRVYLEREDRVSDFHRESYGDFIRFYRRMLSVRPDDAKRIQKLKDEIAQSRMRTGQSWLLERLQAL